jgi:hypothetical protein
MSPNTTIPPILPPRRAGGRPAALHHIFLITVSADSTTGPQGHGGAHPVRSACSP